MAYIQGMKEHLKIEAIVYISIFYLLLAFPSNAQINQSFQTDNPLKTSIDSAVQSAAINYMSDSNAHGLSIGIYRKGIAFTYHYGVVKKGSGRLPSGDDFFNMGSVAKTFVGTLLAQAVIEKRLSLDDDIRHFLPGDYSNLDYQGHPIRFKDLATHTSGLPGTMRTFSVFIQDSLKRLGVAEQVNFYGRYNEDSMLADLHQVEPDTIPGESYRYNSNGMMILVLLLERIYHQSFERLASHWLETHLGMYETKTSLSPAEIDRASQGYDRNNQPVPFVNLKGFLIGPTMNSTIKDMLVYIRANLAQKDPAVKLSHQLIWGEKNGFGMGLGWMIDSSPNGERYFYHDGNTKLGFNTLCTLYPVENLGIIIMASDNISQSKVGDLENSMKKELSNISAR
jgi:CubicO group peptidase (beta-lactamase class C family)